MFTGTPQEYREAARKTTEAGAQITDLLNKIEELGIGITTTRGPFQIIGPNFTIRRTNDRWTFHN